MFTYENIEHAPNNYAKAYIKRKQELQQTFDDPDAMTPEVSCIVPDEKFTFAHLDRIIVDPYVINGANLQERINQIRWQNQLPGVVWARLYRQGENRMEMKQELANLLLEDFVSIPAIINNDNNSETLRDWATRINNGQMAFFTTDLQGT